MWSVIAEIFSLLGIILLVLLGILVIILFIILYETINTNKENDQSNLITSKMQTILAQYNIYNL